MSILHYPYIGLPISDPEKALTLTEDFSVSLGSFPSSLQPEYKNSPIFFLTNQSVFDFGNSSYRNCLIFHVFDFLRTSCSAERVIFRNFACSSELICIQKSHSVGLPEGKINQTKSNICGCIG